MCIERHMLDRVARELGGFLETARVRERALEPLGGGDLFGVLGVIAAGGLVDLGLELDPALLGALA